MGVVEYSERDDNGKVIRKRLEVDFACNRCNQRDYIQSIFAIPFEKVDAVILGTLVIYTDV